MGDKMKDFRSSFDQTIFQDWHFSEQHIRKVEERINRHQKRRFLNLFHRLNKWHKPILGVVVCLIMFIGSLYVMHQESPRENSPGVQGHQNTEFQTFATFNSYATGSDEKMAYTDDQLKKVAQAVNKTNAIINTSLPTVGIATDYLMEVRIDSEKKMVQLVYPHFDVILSEHPFKPRKGETTQAVDLKIGAGKWMKNNEGESRLQVQIGNTYFLIESARMVNPATFAKIAESFTLINNVKPEKATVVEQNPTEEAQQNHHIVDLNIFPDTRNRLDELNGWAIGRENGHFQINITRNSAKDFQDVTPKGITSSHLSGQPAIKGAFINPDTARVAISNLKNGIYETDIYGTSDAGKSWFGPVTLPSLDTGKGQYPVDITFINAKEGWVLTRIVSSGGETESRGGLYHTTDGGKSWSLVSDTPKSHTLPDVNGSPAWNDWISFKDSKIGFTPSQTKSTKEVLDSNSTVLYESTDGGKHWNKTKMALPVLEKEENLIFLKPTFVANKIELPVVITNANRNLSLLITYESSDLGKTWVSNDNQMVKESATEALNVHIDTKHHYWFFDGKFLYINDGGQRMRFDVFEQLPSAVETFNQVGNQFWLVTSNGEIYVSDNHGKTWHKP